MNPWFRFYSRFMTDPDVEELSFEDQRHFVFVLCMKSEGLLDREFGDPLKRERAIARRLGLQGEALTFAKQNLINAGVIDDQWQPLKIFKNYRPVAKEVRGLRKTVFERDGYACQYCGASGVYLECDHVVPVSKNGSNELDNLVTACFSCNRNKGDKSVEEWLGIEENRHE